MGKVIICISINVIQPTRVFAEALGYCETPATSYVLFESLSSQRSWRGSCNSPSTMAYWEVIFTSFFPFKKSIRYGNIIYIILAVAYAFLLLLAVATAFSTTRRQQLWGCASYVVGLKRHIRLHLQITIHLVVGVKHAVVGLLGYATKLHPSGAAMGRSYIHREGYMGDSHQLGSSQRCNSAAWLALLFGIIGSSATYRLSTCTPAALHIVARQFGSLAARQLGSLTTLHLVYSAARQL